MGGEKKKKKVNTRVHLLNQHCGGEWGEQFRKTMKQAKPANVTNINYVNSGPFFLPLSEPQPAAKSTKRPAEEAPSEAPPAKLVVHPRPAVELQTPTIPTIPKSKKELLEFLQKGHQVIDTWTSAVREAASKLLQLEEETRHQADQALRQRTRQLEEERRRVGNSYMSTPSDAHLYNLLEKSVRNP